MLLRGLMSGMLVGIAIACMVLVVKTASVIAAVPIGMREVSAVSLLMGAALFGMMLAANQQMHMMAEFINAYTFESAIGMAVFFILLGLQSKPREKRARSYVLHLMPCPFCMLALAVTTAWASRTGDVWNKELLASVCFSVALLLTVWGLRQIARRFHMEPSVFLNPLLLLSGTMTLVFALFIPNYINAAKMGFNPIMVETLLLGPCLVVGMGLLMGGYSIEQRRQRKGANSQ